MNRVALALVLALTGLLALGSCGGGEDGDTTTTVIREEAPTETTTVTEEAPAAAEDTAPEPEEPAEPEEEAEAEPSGEVPNVVGDRLDVAKRELRDAGYRPRVSGGGVFGVVVDQNWVVCEQQDPDGDRVDINVDRSC